MVDVAAVGLDADLDDLGAQLPQRFGRHLVAGAVGAIDDDAQAVEAQVLRQGALGELDIALLRAFDARGAADAVGGGQQAGGVGVDQILDLPLHLVGELVAVGIEQLDAVVVEGLWEAEIITPRSARSERVSMATAGVGIGPSRNTSMPTAVKPDISAASSM